jgi:hypothetical protein
MKFAGVSLGVECWHYIILDLLTAPDGMRIGTTARAYYARPFVPWGDPDVGLIPVAPTGRFLYAA